MKGARIFLVLSWCLASTSGNDNFWISFEISRQFYSSFLRVFTIPNIYSVRFVLGFMALGTLSGIATTCILEVRIISRKNLATVICKGTLRLTSCILWAALHFKRFPVGTWVWPGSGLLVPFVPSSSLDWTEEDTRVVWTDHWERTDPYVLETLIFLERGCSLIFVFCNDEWSELLTRRLAWWNVSSGSCTQPFDRKFTSGYGWYSQPAINHIVK